MNTCTTFASTCQSSKKELHVVLFFRYNRLSCLLLVCSQDLQCGQGWLKEHFARGRALMPHQIFLSHLFSSYFSPAPEQIFLTFLKSDFYWSPDLVTQPSISSWGTFLLFHKLPCDSEVKNRRERGCHHVSRLYETRSDCNKYLWMSCKLWIIGLFIRFCLSQQQKNCIENKKTVWTCFKAAWPVLGSYERYNSSRFV